jgi:amino acid adenylation domain-containing protein
MRQEQSAIRDAHRHPCGGEMAFPLAAVEQSIAARFEQQVARDPTHLAVQSDECTLSYAELNLLANRIAHCILARRGILDAPRAVAILLPNDTRMLAAILGILKSGAPYVPFEPAFPAERLRYYWQDAGATLLLTNAEHYALAVALTGDAAQVITVDALAPELPSHNPNLTISPNALAYIYYTSGSTGTPKSVYNSQRNLLHHIRRNTNIFQVCPADRFLCLKSFSFAGALKDIFGALLNGASLYLYPLKQQGITRLAAWLVEQEITIYNSVATVFRQLVETLTTEKRFPQLRIIYFGGEAIKASDIAAYQQHFAGDAMLVLGLGSTETGPVTALYLNGASQLTGNSVPLGYAVDETVVLILAENGEPVAAGQEGEIAVKSVYLALGYWHNEALTAQKFLPVEQPHPLTPSPSWRGAGGEVDVPPRLYLTGDIGYLDESGCLYHLGRRDFQLKIRGYRIEPAEIEQALRQHPAIGAVAVVAKALHSGEQGLVAYYVVSPESKVQSQQSGLPAPDSGLRTTDSGLLTVTELRQVLASQVPAYMIPAAFVPVESLPVSAFGKLDLKALVAPERGRPALAAPYVEAQTPLQEQLVTLWSTLLGLDEVGIDDDFLELGGSSILVMQLLTRAEQTFGVEIPAAAFLTHPTIATLAALIQPATVST